jgi:hypothetical protein
MTDYVFLSTTAVAIILAGVAMLTMLLTFAIGVLGRPERNYTVALFGCLALIWAGAILVIVLIKLQTCTQEAWRTPENSPTTHSGE